MKVYILPVTDLNKDLKDMNYFLVFDSLEKALSVKDSYTIDMFNKGLFYGVIKESVVF